MVTFGFLIMNINLIITIFFCGMAFNFYGGAHLEQPLRADPLMRFMAIMGTVCVGAISLLLNRAYWS